MHQGPLCGRDAARAAPWGNQSTGYSRWRLSESPLEQVLGIPWVSSVSTGLIGKGESSDSPFFYFHSLSYKLWLVPSHNDKILRIFDRIVATFARDTGQFRCPICRDLITIPRGGVQALPPSFLVNQLLDLMARQRREVIPKCSTHHNQVIMMSIYCPLTMYFLDLLKYAIERADH